MICLSYYIYIDVDIKLICIFLSYVWRAYINVDKRTILYTIYNLFLYTLGNKEFVVVFVVKIKFYLVLFLSHQISMLLFYYKIYILIILLINPIYFRIFWKAAKLI